MGTGQRGSSVSRQYKNDGILKTGQWHSTVWEGGGSAEKKRFWQTPLTIAPVKGVVIIFLKNTVNTVKILLLKLIVLYV